MEDNKNIERTKPLFEPIEGTLEFAVRVTDSDISASVLYPQKLLDRSWKPSPEMERNSSILQTKVMQGMAEIMLSDPSKPSGKVAGASSKYIGTCWELGDGHFLKVVAYKSGLVQVLHIETQEDTNLIERARSLRIMKEYKDINLIKRWCTPIPPEQFEEEYKQLEINMDLLAFGRPDVMEEE
ncbi:MAG: hypothetical protein LUD72_00960 [Bacteroidales bacterium]|nr:hypothetical protein [Bacteroidales bacterium]